MWYNPRINADPPRQFFAPLGFKSLLSLVANSTEIRAPVMRNAVIRLNSQLLSIMYKGILLLLPLLLLSCKKEAVIDPNLLGKWEAAFYFTIDSDTTFYREGTSHSCAYAVLPYDYNSGFELIDKSTGDLIWCGGNKSDFFKWSYEDQILIVEDGENIYEVFVEERTNNTMKITLNHEEYFYMEKY